MRKNKLLLLLVLLLTAATGAWATDYTTLAVGDVIKVGDTFSPTADGAFNDFGVNSGETYTLMRADIDNDYNVTEKTDGAYYVFKYVSIMSSPYIHFEKAFAVTAISDGLEVTKIEDIKGMPSYTLALHESAAPATYAITLAEGTEDAENWTVPAEAAAGTEVTATYNGTKKVKSVKAVKKKAVDPAKAYLTWDADQKKLVATEIPTTAITVENADAEVNWQAGTYVVEGEDVKINGAIILKGEVNLIIKDGATLTADKIMGGNNNLSIFGQANQSGQLVVNCSNDAISNITILEVHSAKVTASSSANYCGGFFNLKTFNVYGGSVDAKCTGSNGFGIGLMENGSMKIYGGEVKAEGTGSGGIFYFHNDNKKPTVTVYGGKLWAGDANNKALYYVTLTIDKSLGFNGEIQSSSDNSTWNPTVGTPDSKYVRVGYN